MKPRLSRGEVRYALMLVGILLLAAITARTTISHLQDLIYSVEYETQANNLLDLITHDAATLLLAADDYSDRADEDLVRLLEKDGIGIVARLRPNGDVLKVLHAAHRPISYEGLPPDFIDWSALLSSTKEQRLDNGWVGFAKSSVGPVMIALHEGDDRTMITAAIRPLDRVYVSELRNMFSACAGFQPFWALDEPDSERYLHIEDHAGRRIGSFVLRPDLSSATSAVQTISLTFFAQTLGFLFLAGALGLGAIRVIATLEGRRRIAAFVNDLTYLSDGVVVTDRRGRVTGANPAARDLTARPLELGTDRLRDCYSFLTVEDMTLLMDRALPHEVERPVSIQGRERILRLRSQPLADVHLFLISDITRENLRHQHERQLAQLQLIGRIARGVAHDFNNILCAISGHASLLTPQEASAEDRESFDTIQREADRGATLARQLLELSRIGAEEAPCENIREHTEKAANLLRIAIRSSCQVDVHVHGSYPTVNLSGIQVEQLIVNLGLLCADELAQDGYLRIELHPPSELPPYTAKAGAAAVLLISAHDQPSYPDMQRLRPFGGELGDDLGVIFSVVRSIARESGGDVERLVGPRPISCYRVSLHPFDGEDASCALFAEVSDDLRDYVKEWRILVALPEEPYRENVVGSLHDVGMQVELTDDLVSCLSRIQSEDTLNGIVLSQALLGHESSGLVQAILKLKPQAGIVVMTEGDPTSTEAGDDDVVYASMGEPPETVLNMLIRASRLAEQRTQD